jgi:hypothetical protein
MSDTFLRDTPALEQHFRVRQTTCALRRSLYAGPYQLARMQVEQLHHSGTAQRGVMPKRSELRTCSTLHSAALRRHHCRPPGAPLPRRLLPVQRRVCAASCARSPCSPAACTNASAVTLACVLCLRRILNALYQLTSRLQCGWQGQPAHSHARDVVCC